MKGKSQLSQLTPYKPGKNVEDVKHELGLDHIVKLASNENPFGYSHHVKEAIEDEFTQLSVYPDGYASKLRQKVAEQFPVTEDQVIFGNGTDEVIQMICRTYLEEGFNTIMATPTFPQYKHNAVIENADIREIPLKQGGHDLEAMLAAIDEKTKVIWLCMINNPTGVAINQQDLLSFLNRVPRDVVVCLDEAYYEYLTMDDYADTIALINDYPNIIIARTFSKIYGLAALRVGFGVAHQDIIQEMSLVRQPFNVSRIAQTAAAAAIEDRAFIEKCHRVNRQGLMMFYEFCQTYDLFYYPSEANFILIDFGCSGDDIYHYLLTCGYIVRSGVALGYPYCVRITIGSEEQTKDIIHHLTKWMEHQNKGAV